MPVERDVALPVRITNRQLEDIQRAGWPVQIVKVGAKAPHRDCSWDHLVWVVTDYPMRFSLGGRAYWPEPGKGGRAALPYAA